MWHFDVKSSKLGARTWKGEFCANNPWRLRSIILSPFRYFHCHSYEYKFKSSAKNIPFRTFWKARFVYLERSIFENSLFLWLEWGYRWSHIVFLTNSGLHYIYDGIIGLENKINGLFKTKYPDHSSLKLNHSLNNIRQRNFRIIKQYSDQISIEKIYPTTKPKQENKKLSILAFSKERG